MKIIFDREAEKDFLFFKQHNQALYKKICRLLHVIREDPFEGIGKPEPLKESCSGYWSRRISKEHRLIYKVEENILIVASCRYHYERSS